MTQAVNQSQIPRVALHKLDSVCERLWVAKLSMTGEDMAKVLKVTVQHGDFAMFEKYAARHESKLALEYFDWLRNWLDDGENGDESKWTGVKLG